MLANCGSSSKLSRIDPKYGVSSSPRVVTSGETVPKGGGTYRVGKPYTVAGRVYVPQENTKYKAEGLASWYGDAFHGRLPANGEVIDMASLSAAHPTLPLPCYVRVTNLGNSKSLVVRVNDRGPYHSNRLIDVSNKAAELLEFKRNGVAPSPSTVRVASARPFVPELRTSIGETSASGRVPAHRQESEGTREVAYGEGEGEGDVTGHVRPVAAYAPADQSGPSELFSGRGLY